MSFADCKECGTAIPDLAPVCFKCGAKQYESSPAENSPSITPDQKLTAKKRKMEILISAILFWGGTIAGFATVNSGYVIQKICHITMLLGFGLYVITKIRMWWERDENKAELTSNIGKTSITNTFQAKLIQCDTCGKSIANTVEKCIHCGAKNKRKKLGMRDLIIAGVASLFVIGLISSNTSKNTNGEGATPYRAAQAGSDRPNKVSVSPNELAAAYKRNEAAADAEYKEKILLVYGTVESITKDFKDDTSLTLETDGLFGVSAALLESEESEAIRLNKGQKVSLICTGVGEVLSIPHLRNCKISAVY